MSRRTVWICIVIGGVASELARYLIGRPIDAWSLINGAFYSGLALSLHWAYGRNATLSRGD